MISKKSTETHLTQHWSQKNSHFLTTQPAHTTWHFLCHLHGIGSHHLLLQPRFSHPNITCCLNRQWNPLIASVGASMNCCDLNSSLPIQSFKIYVWSLQELANEWKKFQRSNSNWISKQTEMIFFCVKLVIKFWRKCFLVFFFPRGRKFKVTTRQIIF